MEQAHATSPQVDLRQDRKIVIPAAIILCLIVIASIAAPVATENFLKSIYGPFAKHTGTYYLWVTFIMVALSAFFICSRYGNIRFGDRDEKPEFGNGAWIAMMFCSGVAGAVMF
jgi:BCCT family betaine/carnitine transporter